MIQFLENKNIEFMNLSNYISDVFNRHIFSITTPSENLVRNIVKQLPINHAVQVDNRLVTANLRMIGSPVPEKLAMCAFKCLEESKSLLSIIDELSEEEFLYSPSTFARRVIKYRFTDLFEAILYSDFFEKVWKGDFIANRCFVFKQNSKLKYYDRHQTKMLAQFFVDNIDVKSKRIKTSNSAFSFQLIFKMNSAQ